MYSKMRNNTEDWVQVTTLSGEMRCMLRGRFIWPAERYDVTTRKNEKYYAAVSDREKFSISPAVQEICEVIAQTLSRDERDTFQDPLKVEFRGGPDNPVVPGSSLSWWHLSSRDHPRSQLRSGYKKILTNLDKADHYEYFLRKLGTSSSAMFTNNFSRGHLAPSSTGVPKARYHCGLNQLIDSYKRILDITDVEFRIHGTTFYPMEIMHSVLICPKGTDILNARYPLLEVTGFSARGQYKAPTAENVVSVEKNEEGEYRIIWRPFCTRNEDAYDRDERLSSSMQWDHVTFAFFLPPGKPQRLPLPVPYWRQDKLNNDRQDTRFNEIHVKVTGDDGSASDDHACASDGDDADSITSDLSAFSDNSRNSYDNEDSFIDDTGASPDHSSSSDDDDDDDDDDADSLTDDIIPYKRMKLSHQLSYTSASTDNSASPDNAC